MLLQKQLKVSKLFVSSLCPVFIGPSVPLFSGFHKLTVPYMCVDADVAAASNAAAGRRLLVEPGGLNEDASVGALAPGTGGGAQFAAGAVGGGRIPENASWENARPRPVIPYGSIGLLWVGLLHSK